MARHSKAAVDEARAQLREWLKPGDTVYTVLEHVSRSGMSREVRVLVPYTRDDGTVDFLHPNYSVGVLLGLRQGKRDGLIVGGAGMDVGFWLVYSLARKLWPEGFPCTGEGCPSNDHNNGLREYTPGKVQHLDGGYALRQRWL